MRKLSLVTILFSFLTSQEIFAKVSFGAGASIWAYDKDYIMQFNPELKMEFSAGKSLVNLDLILPIFVGLNYSSANLQTAAEAQISTFYGFGFYLIGFPQGIQLLFDGTSQGVSVSGFNQEHWPELLSNPVYLITYIKNLSFKMDNFSARYSPDTPLPDAEIGNILWYNPFFDKLTGLVNRYLEVEFFNGSFQSSSLTDPGLFSLDYIFRPFSESAVDILRETRLTPLAWIDFRNQIQVDGGAGVGIATGLIGTEKFKIRFSTDAHFYSSHLILNEDFSYRINAGASFQFQPIGFTLMYINKSASQPYGPFLSPLYLSRPEIVYSTYTKNHGIDIGLIPGFGSKLNASVNTEIYPEAPFNFSIRAQIRYEWEKNYLGIAFIRENMVNIVDLTALENSETFLELHLKAYIVPQLFVVEWRNILNFSDSASLKSVLSLMAYF